MFLHSLINNTNSITALLLHKMNINIQSIPATALLLHKNIYIYSIPATVTNNMSTKADIDYKNTHFEFP